MMTPQKYNRQKKLWESAAEFGKVILKITDGDSGVVFIAKGEGAAAIVLADSDGLEDKELVQTWEMFRNRLDDMIRHAKNGDFSKETGNKVFIRDSETGGYTKVD